MKYFVVLSCLFVVAYGFPPEILAKIKERLCQSAAECKEKTTASDDEISLIKKHEAPTTDKGKCFLACMNKKFGFQDENGKIDKDASYNLIEQLRPFDEDMAGKMIQVANSCFGQVTDATDECETATNMFACFQKENHAVGIEPIDFST